MDTSIGVYIHVPFCKHECPYCDFYKLALRSRPARARLDFPGLVAREWELLGAQHPELTRRTLDTIYFGGGTPSTLVPEAVGGLVTGIMKSCGARAEEVEVTLEANPENLTEGRCAKWAAAGVTRLSIGVQSFDARELKLLERLHEPELVSEVVANARRSGFRNISLDLMFGLPGQTMNTWRANLRRAVELELTHISLYGLTWHEGTPFHAARAEGRLRESPEDLQAKMYLYAAEYLESAEFDHYEISNFARPGCRSRHNQRYWRRLDVAALGPGAHGNLGAKRWANPEDLDAWAAAIREGRLPESTAEELSPETILEERLFTGLRRREGVSREGEPDLYRQCAAWYRAQHERDARRLMTLTEKAASLTREGWLVSDAMIDAILRAGVTPFG